MRGRVFAETMADTALAELRKRVAPLGGTFRFAAQGPFILASSSSHTAEQLAKIGASLDSIRTFYRASLGLGLPDSLITVYLVPDQLMLGALAKRLHGVELHGSSLIGYSVFSDLSLAAVIPYQAQGTLAHELMHLALRYNYPEVPAWLDEGLAALYEVAELRGDSVIGVPNWRSAVLRVFAYEIPPLSQLTQMTNADFQGNNNDLYAVHAATARYFMLFLQNHGVLRPVLDGMRRSAGVVAISGTGELDTARATPPNALTLAAGALRIMPSALQQQFTDFVKRTTEGATMQCVSHD
jgi:hypothetical protein